MAEIDWDFRSTVTYLSKRIAKQDQVVYQSKEEMHGMSAGSGITPFLNDHRREMALLHKLQDELIALCKKGTLGEINRG